MASEQTIWTAKKVTGSTHALKAFSNCRIFKILSILRENRIYSGKYPGINTGIALEDVVHAEVKNFSPNIFYIDKYDIHLLTYKLSDPKKWLSKKRNLVQYLSRNFKFVLLLRKIWQLWVQSMMAHLVLIYIKERIVDWWKVCFPINGFVFYILKAYY